MGEIQNQYETLFQHMAQGAFFQDKSGVLIDVNPAALEMFGLTRDQFLGKTSLHPDWRVIKEDGSELLPEQHPSVVALGTGKEVHDFIAGVYNPLLKHIIWMSINACPMFRDGEEKPYQTFVTLHDISAQLQTKKLSQSRLQLLDFAQTHTRDELLVFTLDEVEKLTGSMIGFYHFYDADTLEITLNAWSTRTTTSCYQVASAKGHFPLEQAGIWADCIREARPVVHNVYQSLSHHNGLPEGHAQVVRELVVPVKRDGRVVAILGVGNSLVDYTDADVNTVTLYADMVWEIAERKRSELLLQQSELRCRRLSETSLDGYWVVDGSGHILAVNSTMTEIYGYDYDEFLSKTVADFEVIEDESQIQQHIQQIKSNSCDRFESKHRLKNGQIIDVEIGTTYLSESDTFLSFVRDITHRIKAEEELRISEEKFRAIFEQAGGYCMILDPNTTDGIPVIVDANNAACEVHGYNRDEFIGRSVADIDDEDGRRLVKDRTKKIMTGKPFNVENVHVRKDGTSFHVAVNAQRINIGDSPPLIFTTEYDITARKVAEIESQNTNELLAMFMKHSPIYTFVKEVTAAESRVLQASENYEQMVGIPGSKMAGKTMGELFPAELARRMTEDDWEVVSGGEVLEIEEELGGRTYTSIKYPIQQEARTLLAGYTIDITERKKAEKAHLEYEAQLRQKYKMEAVGVMAGGMAHNFNNNLAIILGNLSLSQRKLPPQSGVGDYLNCAKIAAERAGDLVKQIMTYSRKETRSQAPLQLSLLLKETTTLFKSTIPSSVKLQQEVSSDCDHAYIRADASQIQECLLNLCNNAVYAMEEQGELLLRLERVELGQKDIPARYHCSPGCYLCLSVQDNGCGIPAEIQEKIFDPFFTTKELYEGTGMGLSTVQGIVEQHHGMITVESGIGQKTTFYLYFAVDDQLQKEEVAGKEVELQRGSERILYVDDDAMIANLNKQILSEMGYQVTVETDSVEALKHFSENVDSYDLVMTDQTMPELTGIELIQKIKLLRPEIPTILSTGYSSKVNEEEARQAGITAFLMKPTDFAELSRVIRTVLEKPSAP